MKMNNRYQDFLALLMQKGKLELPEICEYFGVSDSTARRLCIEAEKSGEGVRIYGGGLQSLKALSAQMEYSFENKTAEHIDEKMDIGYYASNLVESNEVIYVSSGTTTQQFMFYLSKKVNSGEIRNVSVMTNSLLFVEMSSDKLPVILTGGKYRSGRRDFAGEVAEISIRGAHFSKSFIGTDGVELPYGLIASDTDTANLDSLAASRSDAIFILADSSKFISKSYICYQPFLPKNIVVTDSGVSETFANLAADNGISLKIVEKGIAQNGQFKSSDALASMEQDLD